VRRGLTGSISVGMSVFRAGLNLGRAHAEGEQDALILNALSFEVPYQAARAALYAAEIQGLCTNSAGACYLPKEGNRKRAHAEVIDLRVFSGIDAWWDRATGMLFIETAKRSLRITKRRGRYYHVADVESIPKRALKTCLLIRKAFLGS